MKLFFAAPRSGLPSALTALLSQASCLHFFIKLVLAAPRSGLPSALTALLSQDCAMAVPTTQEVIRATRIRRVIASLRSTRQFCRSDKRAVFDLGQIQDRRAQTIVYPRSTF